MDDEDLIKPTKGEKKNGWTKESLTMYIRSRKVRSQESVLLSPRLSRRKAQTSTENSYDPYKW